MRFIITGDPESVLAADRGINPAAQALPHVVRPVRGRAEFRAQVGAVGIVGVVGVGGQVCHAGAAEAGPVFPQDGSLALAVDQTRRFEALSTVGDGRVVQVAVVVEVDPCVQVGIGPREVLHSHGKHHGGAGLHAGRHDDAVFVIDAGGVVSCGGHVCQSDVLGVHQATHHEVRAGRAAGRQDAGVVAEVVRRRGDGHDVVLDFTGQRIGAGGAEAAGSGKTEAHADARAGHGSRGHCHREIDDAIGRAGRDYDVGGDPFATVGEDAVVVEVEPRIQEAIAAGGVRDRHGKDQRLTSGDRGNQHAVLVIAAGDVVPGGRRIPRGDKFRVQQCSEAQGRVDALGRVREAAVVSEVRRGCGHDDDVIFHFAVATGSDAVRAGGAGEAEAGAEIDARQCRGRDGDADVLQRVVRAGGDPQVGSDLLARVVEAAVVVEVDPGVQVGIGAGQIGHLDGDGGRSTGGHRGEGHAVFVIHRGDVVTRGGRIHRGAEFRVHEGSDAESRHDGAARAAENRKIAEVRRRRTDDGHVVLHFADPARTCGARRDVIGQADAHSHADAGRGGGWNGQVEAAVDVVGSRGNEDIAGDLFSGVGEDAVVVEIDPGIQVAGGAGIVRHTGDEGDRCTCGHRRQRHAVFVVHTRDVIPCGGGIGGGGIFGVHQGPETKIRTGSVRDIRCAAEIAEVRQRCQNDDGVILHLSDARLACGAGILDVGDPEAGSQTCGRRHGIGRDIEVEGGGAVGGAVRHGDVDSHLFARVRQHAIVVEVDPRVDVTRGPRGVRHGNGQRHRLARRQVGEDHAVFVIGAGDVVAVGIRGLVGSAFHVHQGADAQGGAGSAAGVSEVEFITEVQGRLDDGGRVIFNFTIADGARRAGRADGGQAHAHTHHACGRSGGHREVDGAVGLRGAVGDEDVAGDLFASVGEHAVAVKVHPGMKEGRRTAGVGHTDGHGAESSCDDAYGQ